MTFRRASLLGFLFCVGCGGNTSNDEDQSEAGSGASSVDGGSAGEDGGSLASAGEVANGGASEGQGGDNARGGAPGSGGALTGGTGTGGAAARGGAANGGSGTGGGSGGAVASGGAPEGGGGVLAGGGTAGSQEAGGGTAGSQEAGGMAGAEAGTAGVGGESHEWHVDAVNGSDLAPGTEAEPLRTLTRAAYSAQPGDTVILHDGIWDGAVDAPLGATSSANCGDGVSGILFGENVSLRAQNPGAARIVTAGDHGICMSGGSVESIRFGCAHEASDVTRSALEAQSGVVEVVGTSFENCVEATPLVVAGTAAVTLRPGELSDYLVAPRGGMAVLSGQGQLVVDGGKLTMERDAFVVGDTARLELHGVTVVSEANLQQQTQAGILLRTGAPGVRIDGGTQFENVGVAIDGMDASSQIAIEGMTITGGNDAIQLLHTVEMAPAEIAINDLTVTGVVGAALSLQGSYELSITNSRVSGTASIPFYLIGSGTVNLDSVSITDSGGGLLFTSIEGRDGFHVTGRNLTITGGELPGVIVIGATNDVIDLGTGDSPGNNTFTGNDTTTTDRPANLAFMVPDGVVVMASGNTWEPDQQGADADGHYSVGAAAEPLDVTSGDGPNYRNEEGNTGALRLADIPTP